jgi:hypothetical protein
MKVPERDLALGYIHWRMARGRHELPKVSSWPAMPCRQVTRETALWPFQG